jgi:hypothetical protein
MAFHAGSILPHVSLEKLSPIKSYSRMNFAMIVPKVTDFP